MAMRNLAVYRQNLETQRRRLAQSRWDSEAIEVQRVADSMDDTALENERHVALEACSRNAHLLAEVTEALRRMDAGAYGCCVECGEPISVRRLSAMPWARLCLKCQEEAEREPLADARWLGQGLTHAA
ncbi:MAG TPA: TraR/DksA family transcriptional regulator [Terriglobia bacterium]|nr:TraR/DksA family transcriptional regulator [Terriglobia bacterium]